MENQPFCWETANANERNQFIGDLIGAEPLSQYYITYKGKHMAPMPYSGADKEKAEELFAFCTGEGWNEFCKDRGILKTDKALVGLELFRWHMRYSDTPGGGWDVIEAIRKRGFFIQCRSLSGGWEVSGSPAGTFGKICRVAPTMAEAACLLAIRCLGEGREG